MTPRNGSTARGAVGLVLIAAGLLVMAVSGFYTATAFVTGLAWNAPWLLVAVLVMGGVPITVGFFLFAAGRRLWATPLPRRGDDPASGGDES